MPCAGSSGGHQDANLIVVAERANDGSRGLGELCALELEDVEDDGEAMFLKIRRGKGAKFRRVPVSHRLRRELLRYVNRVRPDSANPQLLLLRDGRPVDVECVSDLFQRTRGRIGFRVHAHKFRSTFATEYLRNGGEIERLRRILGLRDGHALRPLGQGRPLSGLRLRTPF